MTPYKPPNSKDLFIVGSVDSDDTMKDWIQHLEFEIETGNPLKFQLTIDRKNKYNIKDSKPVCFLHFSDISQMMKIIELMSKTMCLISFRNNKSVNSEDVALYLENLFDSIKHQIIYSISNVPSFDVQHDVLKNKIESKEELIFE